MQLKWLDIVSAESSDAEGNVWSTSKCRIHEQSDHRQVFFAVSQFVFAAGVTQIFLRIK